MGLRLAARFRATRRSSRAGDHRAFTEAGVPSTSTAPTHIQADGPRNQLGLACIRGCCRVLDRSKKARAVGLSPNSKSPSCDRLSCSIEWAFVAICTPERSEEHTSELQSLMRISYAVFCLKKK